MIKALLKIFFIGITLYSIFLAILLTFIFTPISNDAIQKNQDLHASKIKLLEEQLYKPLLNIEYSNISDIVDPFIANNNVVFFEVKLLDYFLTTDNLLANSSNVKTKDWVLGDIAIDDKYGTLEKTNDIVYRFINNDTYLFERPIKVKFQAVNEETMANSISTISFKLPEFYVKEIEPLSFSKEKLKTILDIKNISFEKEYKLSSGQRFASLRFSYHQNHVVEEIYTLLTTIISIYSIVFVVIFALYFLISYILMSSYIVRHLDNLLLYMNDIENNKFYKFKTKTLKHQHVIDLADVASKLSKKLAAIINELNVNKDLLEQQISIDPLTKLPNRKMYEIELKSLFITHVDSYIGKIKLLCLKDFAQNNDQDEIDQFIQDFSRTIKISFEKYTHKFSSIFRLYGSEFVFVSKHSTFDQISDVFEELDKLFAPLKKEHNIEGKLFHGIALPLYKYTSIPKINKDLDDLYEKTLNNDKTHYVIDNDDIDQESEKLEKTIKSIIKNNAFTIGTKFDTFSFMDPDELLIQEIAPNLIDTEGKNIPIGTFISVAEALNIAVEFDKNVILKTFREVRRKELSHQVAVNISISSMCDDNFINWLEAQALYEYKDVLDRVVFSITSFAANANFEKFKTFTQRLKEVNAQALLKRYNYNDLNMEQLESLHLNYIRVHKDYTTHIDHEREVILRNMVSLSNLNQIKVLGDVVTNQHDYDVIKNLRFYGTSR